MDILYPFQYAPVQFQVGAGNIRGKLLHGGGADDRTGHERPPVDESQGHLGRVQAVFPGDGNVLPGALLGNFGVIAFVFCAEQGQARPRGPVAVQVFA